MGDFSLVFKNINDKTEQQLNRIIKKSVFDLTSAIIQDTPVDSGRLRANWLVSFNTPIDAELKLEDKEGTATIAKAKALIGGSKVPLVYWIQNNLPYANVVEFGLYPNPVKFGSRTKQAAKGSPVKYQVLSMNGFSAKAPQGMVRINILRFNKYLQANLKGS